MRQKIDASELYAELEERLREELDYVREADNLREFRRLLRRRSRGGHPGAASRVLLAPRADDERRSKATRSQDILAPGVDQQLKDWVAVKYFRVLWRQIFEFGILHTDPHPGNYLVTHHPHLCMLDLGSVRVFPEPIRARVRRPRRARCSTTTRR